MSAATAAAAAAAVALSSFGSVSETQMQEALPSLVLPNGAAATAEGSLGTAETSLAGWHQQQQHQQQQQLAACKMEVQQSIISHHAAAAAAAAGGVEWQPGLGNEQGSAQVWAAQQQQF